MEKQTSASSPSNKLRVLIIDDEKNIRATLSLCLEQMGCAVTAVSTPEAALAALRQQPYDLAFLDLRLGESNGLDFIPKLLTVDAGLQVIVITAYATIDTAVDAIKRGAADYLPKPFTPQQIRHVVDQSIKQRDLKITSFGPGGTFARSHAGHRRGNRLTKNSLYPRSCRQGCGFRRPGAVTRRKRHGKECAGAHDSFHEPTQRSLICGG